MRISALFYWSSSSHIFLVLNQTEYYSLGFEFIQEYYPGVGYCSEKTTVFLAVVSNEDKIEEGGGLEVEGEMLEILEYSVDEVFRDFDNGVFIDGKTIIALQEFKNRHIERLVLSQDQKIESQDLMIKDLQTKLSLIEGTPRV